MSQEPNPLRVTTLNPRHANAAARLHIEGQPGTFLSALGDEVLTLLYQELSQSAVGFGFAVVDSQGNLLAFASATPNVGRLFLDLGLRRAHAFLLPLLNRFVREPRLLLLSMQTALYPLRQGHGQGSDCAELLSIMTKTEYRGRGLGGALLNQIVTQCRHAGIAELEVTVDSHNRGAARFYRRHGFTEAESFRLYGRSMTRYSMSLAEERMHPEPHNG